MLNGRWPHGLSTWGLLRDYEPSDGTFSSTIIRPLLTRGRSRRWALVASNSLQKGRSSAGSAVTARCGTSTTADTAASPAKLSSGETPPPQAPARPLVNQLYLQDMSIMLSINPELSSEALLCFVFRRAVNWQNKNNRTFQCKFENKCEITIRNRKTCQSCRFQVGELSNN